ncbi:hypothetical protein EVAR_94020_1 [Eumeta japonica]|uniref:Uncharacterized protein n=1 Tax=Eumeta variegata TaxID=151549 RepID=A0A4C2ACA9_EUMVA|nr:hypothetical protein EVAR_94020_1 [Eumeta japonica]
MSHILKAADGSGCRERAGARTRSCLIEGRNTVTPRFDVSVREQGCSDTGSNGRIRLRKVRLAVSAVWVGGREGSMKVPDLVWFGSSSGLGSDSALCVHACVRARVRAGAVRLRVQIQEQVQVRMRVCVCVRTCVRVFVRMLDIFRDTQRNQQAESRASTGTEIENDAAVETECRIRFRIKIVIGSKSIIESKIRSENEFGIDSKRLMMELEGGHRNSVIKRRNPIEFGLV